MELKLRNNDLENFSSSYPDPIFFSRVFGYRRTSTSLIEKHNDDRQIERKKGPRAREQESGSRAPPADKMIKRQISYIIFTLMLPYRNLWEGRDLCGRVYAPRGLILRAGPHRVPANRPVRLPSVRPSGPDYSRASAASGRDRWARGS